MMLDVREADPFVLLVHHRHAFDAWDPIRPLFRALLPEGFPAHPHRGFETVTMTLQGGLAHRDSLGVAQIYGDGDVQWLTAAEGLLHEEMWWRRLGTRDCELYQLWLNLPRDRKRDPPAVSVLRDPEDIEAVRPNDGVLERRLGGRLGCNQKKTTEASSTASLSGPARGDARCAQVLIEPGATYDLATPDGATVLLYARAGAVDVGGDTLPRHHLGYTTRDAALRIRNAGTHQADLLLLYARPLNEPVVASGTWVVASQSELDRANADYNSGALGVPWDHQLDDATWQAHVRRYPARTTYASGGQDMKKEAPAGAGAMN